MVAPLLALPLLAKIFLGTAAAGAGVGVARAATGTQMKKKLDERSPFGPSRTMFGETMDFLSLTAQPVQNMFAGRWESAARTLGDVGLRLVDAFIPGKALPTLSRRSDIISPTELVSDAIGVNPDNVPWYVRLPTDIAGDIVTNPTSLITFGGQGAANAVARTGNQLAGIKAAHTAARNAVGAGKALDNIPAMLKATKGVPFLVQQSDNIIKDAVMSGMTRSGRKALLKRGSSVSEFADTLMKAGSNDASKVAGLMRDPAAMAKMAGVPDHIRMFQHGGVQVAGKQVLQPGQVSAMLDAGIDAVGTKLPGVARAIRGAGDVAGRVTTPVARMATQLTGGMYGVSKPIQRALKNAKRMGNKHHAVVATNVENIFSAAPKDAWEDLFNVMSNVSGQKGQYTALVPMESLPALLDKPGQMNAFMARVEAARAGGAQFGGLTDDAIRALGDDIISQNMTLFNIDTTLGMMKPPQMWTAPDGTRRTVAEMLDQQDGVLRALGDDVSLGKGKLDLARQALDDAVAKLSEAAVPGNATMGDVAPKIRDLQVRRKIVEAAQAAVDDAVDMLSANEAVRGKFAELGYTMTPINTALESPPLYMQRIFKQPAGGTGSGTKASFEKSRVLREHSDFVAYLNSGAELTTDPLEVMLRRAEASGRSVSRAQVARNLVGDDLVGRDLEAVLTRGLEELAGDFPEMAMSITKFANPLPPRTGFFRGLNGFNRFWKPSVLYGIGVPRFMVFGRNRLGGVAQAIAEPGANLRLGSVLSDTVNSFKFMGHKYWQAGKRALGREGNLIHKFRGDLADAATDAVSLTLSKDKIVRGTEILDLAETLSRGDFRKMGQSVRQVMKSKGLTSQSDQQLGRWLHEAWDTGVMDGYVNTEELLRRMGRTERQRGVFDLLDVPGEVYQHTEHRMRLGQFLQLRSQGVPASEASRAVMSAYLDYGMAGVADRTMRDIIPFAAFMSRTIPQQFAALSRYGAYRSGIASIYTGIRTDKELPQWVQDQAHVDLGIKDTQGNPIIAAGLGNPMEALNIFPSNLTPDLASLTVPELGDTVRRTILSSSQPLLKELYAQGSGRDPFFGTKVGSYDKTPAFLRWFGAPERSEAGRFIQAARRTGLAAPFEPFLAQTEQLSDERTGVGAKLTRLFTGVRLVPVDEDRARIQNLQRRMETDPRVQSGQFFYSQSPNPATQQLLDAFKSAQQRARRKRDTQE